MNDSALANTVYLFDTLLRDGSQMRGISFSVNDKIKITRLLDDFGVHYIECGWPGSNPKDYEFFQQIKSIPLKQAKIVAFSSTRRKGVKVQDDQNLQSLLEAETPAVCLFAKSWTLHVEKVLETTLEENLAMIFDSVSYMKEKGREVIYDGEHFFDGFRANRDYALETLRSAAQAGARWLVLCDTNGGSLPVWIDEVVKTVMNEVVLPLRAQGREIGLGIHAHNDSELAVANSLTAVAAGVTQVQGTMNGYGERCGNANLISIIANLQLKMGKNCVAPEKLKKLTDLSRKLCELSNMSPNSHAPYVGSSAFAHKAGIHVSAVEKVAESYEHIDPENVGNKREILISELSGRGNIRVRAADLGIEADGLEGKVVERIKELEAEGFQFENAEGSFELLIRREQGEYTPPFKVIDATIISERRADNPPQVQAIVRLDIDGKIEHTVADAFGPVDALDKAMRKALIPYFPPIALVHLTDYKVRILDPDKATSAVTRVMIEAADSEMDWATIGCSGNIIEASLHALIDSYEYFLLKKSGSN